MSSIENMDPSCSVDGDGVIISYVYMNLVITAFALIFVIGFAYRVWNRFEEILEYHNTISSFCAQKNTWENRFLVIFTTIVSMNLMFLHFEEYNSRNEHSPTMITLFLIEIISIFLFILVGIFYTTGNNPNNQNAEYEAAFGKLEIKLSGIIHTISAAIFFNIITAVNLGYAIHLVNIRPNKKWTYILLVWSILSIIIACIHILSQIMIVIIKKKLIANNESNEDNPEQIEKNKEEYSQNMKINARLRTLRAVCFISEALWGLSIITQDAFGSVRRNKWIQWYGKDDVFH